MPIYRMGSRLLVAAAVALLGCSGSSDEVVPHASAAPGKGGEAGSDGVGGQGGSPTGAGGGQAGAGGAGGSTSQATDFGLPGPYGVTAVDGSVAMIDCGPADTMSYTLYAPDGVQSALLLTLGHGFSRSRQNMAVMADRIASYGVRVAAFDYCHLSALDTDHPQNGADQIALAAALAEGAPVIHAGYSAGGLAAILAAAADPRAIALLALDAVDNQDLGAAALPGISLPVFGLEGEPSSCNKENNSGTHLAALAPNGWAVLATGATHCDFEDPTGWLCTNFCGGEGQDGQRELIRSLATAFVAWQAGVDATGQTWVTAEGSAFQTLLSSGAIAEL